MHRHQSYFLHVIGECGDLIESRHEIEVRGDQRMDIAMVDSGEFLRICLHQSDQCGLEHVREEKVFDLVAIYLNFEAEMHHVDQGVLVGCFECHQIHQAVDSVEDVPGVARHENAVVELREEVMAELKRTTVRWTRLG